MNKHIKKLLCAAVSLAMVAGTIVLPMTASAEITPIFDGDTVEKEWKFDFGADDQTPADGFTAVKTDAYFDQSVSTSEYGFLGTNENDYRLGNRYDGFGTQQGQVIELGAGGSGDNDAIGVIGAGGTGDNVGKDIYGNQADIYYPLRFALKAEDDAYYRVRATVTTFDPEQDAEISLYTERKHPIFTDAKVTAGTTKTVEFSVRPTPIYYEKSSPTGTIADGMVNISVAGTNAALASLEIQKVQPYPVFWVLGDSTVTDGNCSLPFFKPQNCTGVGTGLTKYLPRNIAMVNEGEGGLNAADSAHFNMVKNRIKAGDYLYVEYGHNHKNDGATGYKSCLQKYLDACNSATGGKANLIIVSPIERINQWDSATSKYTHSLDSFASAGKAYVEEKITAGADNIAYVDLNTYSLDFYNKIVADNGNDANAIKYYFQTGKGAGTDTTHPNDIGAENLAYEFIKAAQAVTDAKQKAVLDKFLNDITNETPNLAPASLTSSPLGGTAWPTYLPPVQYPYPVAINDVQFNDDGTVKQVDVTTQPSKITMDSYGIIVITVTGANGVEKGKFYAVDQVDNSTDYGPQTITNFRSDPAGLALAEGDTYSAIVMKAKDEGSGLVVDESNTAFSAKYTPSDIEKLLITNEDKTGIEDFNYFGANYEGGEGATNLTDKNGWAGRGSGGKTLTLGQSGDTKYANIITDGAKNGTANQGSFYVSKELEEAIGTTGKYMISMDMKYISGGGLNVGFVTGNTDKDPWGSESFKAYIVNSDGNINANGQNVGQVSAADFTNVTYILDMDYGTASISVAGADPTTYKVANYDTTSTDINPKKLTSFMFDSNKVAVGIQIANLTVAKLKQKELPKKTVTVASSDDTHGTVSIVEGTGAAPVETGYTLSYSGGNAVVTAAEAGSATLIEAKYDANGKLTDAIPTKFTFDAAGSKETAVTEGSKLMLWTALSGDGSMQPLTNAIKAEEVPVTDGKSISVPLNTTVTAKAEAAAGYVFVNWTIGDDEVSRDADYTVRAHSDEDTIALKANFAKQKDANDAAKFNVTADKQLVKAGAEQTITFTVSDIVDSDGNGVYYTDADIQVSAPDTVTAGTVADGKVTVTVPAEFTIAENTVTDVEISFTVGSITNKYKVGVYSYGFYEDVRNGKTTAAFDGPVGNRANKDCIGMPTGGSTSTFTLPEPVKLDGEKTITYIVAGGGTDGKLCGQPRRLEFYDSTGKQVINEVIGYSWGTLTVGGTVGQDSIADGTNFADALVLNTWTAPVTITLKTDGTGTVEWGGTTANITVNTAATDIAQIKLIASTGAPSFDARGIGITEITIK